MIDLTPNELRPVAKAARALEDAQRTERAASHELRCAIRKARRDGMSLAQIAGVVGVSRQRIDQLSKEGQR